MGFLDEGHRLPQPENCPDWFYRVMHQCWPYNRLQRPPFIAIADCLTSRCVKQHCYYNMKSWWRLICVGFSIYKQKFELNQIGLRGASKKLYISELWSRHSTGAGADTSFQESGIIYWGTCAKRMTSIQITEEADRIVGESSVKNFCKKISVVHSLSFCLNMKCFLQKCTCNVSETRVDNAVHWIIPWNIPI